MLLCAAWVALGIAGHDPWKTEDATSIGVATEMARSRDFVVPTLAGEPYLPRPPLAYIGGALAIDAFAPPLKVHNAARIFAGIALALVLLATALASRELNGRAFRWLPVLILVGSVGFWDRAHVLSPELLLTVGVAVGAVRIRARAAAARVGRRGRSAPAARSRSSATAAGAGLARSSPRWSLPACGPEWRNRAYRADGRHRGGRGRARARCRGRSRCTRAIRRCSRSGGPAKRRTQYIAMLGGDSADPVVLPAQPRLVRVARRCRSLLWLLWLRGRGFNGGLREPGIVVPGVLALVIFASLLVMPEARLANALPLLVPLALLAGARGRFAEARVLGRARLVRHPDVRAARRRDVGACGSTRTCNGMPGNVARFFRDTEVGYQPSFHLGTMLAATGLTVLWVMLVRPARRSNRRAILNWAAGVTLIWGLASTIWLPYLDSRRSYRWTVEERRDARCRATAASRAATSASRSARCSTTSPASTPCATKRSRTTRAAGCSCNMDVSPADPEPPEGWTPIWSGARRGDDTERFVLYKRTP